VLRGFIEGVATSKEEFKSVIDKRTPLIYSLSYREDISSVDTLMESRNKVKEKVKNSVLEKPIFFNIRDPYTNDSIVVRHHEKLDLRSALVWIAERRIFHDLSCVE